MTPEEIARLVYKYHNIPYVMHNCKDRHKDFVVCKHEAMYLIRHFNPKITFESIGLIFLVNHDTVLYAVDKVSNNIRLYAEDKERIKVMMKRIREKMGVKYGTYTYKLKNKRIIVRQHNSNDETAYEVRLRRLVEKRTIEEVSFTLSEDAYKAIIHSYKILNL